MRLALNAEGKSNFAKRRETYEDNKQDRMARNLREVITAVSAERRAKVAAAYRQKLIALKKKRRLEEAKRVMELDSNLIVIAVIITALPIVAALAWMLTALAVGGGAR
jgi:aminoglycoside phosphotransferase family enzyme